jgi:hypothetical protein
MRKLALIVLVWVQLGFLPVWAQKTIMDENAQLRQVEAFQAINVSSAFDVYLTQDNQHTVVVSASEAAIRDQIVAEVKGGTLYINLKKSNFDWRSSRKPRAYISTPELNKISLSGATDLTIENVFKTDDLELSISGSSDFKGNLECKNLRLTSSGSSDYKIGGSAENLKISISGSSDVKGFEMITDYCDINCSGTSDVQITVNRELEVNLSGKSSVAYKGSGIVREMKSSGSSSLKKSD